MKSPRNVRGALAVATCSLLAAGTSQAGDGSWQLDTAVALFYWANNSSWALPP